MRRDPERAAALRVFPPAGGGEENDSCVAQGRVVLDLPGEAAPVQNRHHEIGDHQRERLTGALCGRELRQCRAGAIGHGNIHPPAGAEFAKDRPIRFVIVHHQDAQILEFGRLIETAPLRLAAETRGE